MKKPQIIVESDTKTRIWGYSFKECIDYIKVSYNISDIVYQDLIDWGDPILLEYPFCMIEKQTEEVKDPHQFIADQILTDVYGHVKVLHRDTLVESIKMIFIQFGIKHTIEDIPIVAFLKF